MLETSNGLQYSYRLHKHNIETWIERPSRVQFNLMEILQRKFFSSFALYNRASSARIFQFDPFFSILYLIELTSSIFNLGGKG